MKLSELRAIVSLDIVRDGEFRSLGMLTQQPERMLAPFYDAKYADKLGNPAIACILASPSLGPLTSPDVALALSPDPADTFYRIHRYLMTQTTFYGDPFPSEIAVDAVIHPTAHVSPHNVRIGRRSVVGPKAVILERTSLGEDVVIGPGAIIGGEGFEPKWIANDHVIVPHAGGVRIGDRVEIQANSHVARAVFNGCTEIGSDVKIDALVHVAHNARIGCHCEIAAGAVIAGSASLGERVWIGPSATVSSEVTVGDGAFVALGSVVVRRVTPGQRVFGVPARPIRPAEDARGETTDG